MTCAVRRLHAAVDALRNGESVGQRIGRRQRRIGDRLTAAVPVRLGTLLMPVKRGEVSGVRHVGRIGDAFGEPERAVFVEQVDDAFAVVVVVDAVAGAQHAVAAVAQQLAPEAWSHIGGVGNRQARPEIVLLHRPIGLKSPRAWPAGANEMYGCTLLPSAACWPRVSKPLVEIGGGRDLLAVDLIRRLQQRMMQAEGERQIRPDTPRVLPVILEFVVLEIAIEREPRAAAASRLAIGRDLIIRLRGDVVEQAGQVGHRVVIGAGEVRIDRGQAEGRGIEARTRADDAAVHQRVGIRHPRAVGQGVTQALIVNQTVLPAEADGVTPVRPGEIVDEVMYRHSRRRCLRVSAMERAHAIEIRVRALADACGRVALANVAVAQAVHQIRRERGSQSRSQSLAVIAIGGTGRIARETAAHPATSRPEGCRERKAGCGWK